MADQSEVYPEGVQKEHNSRYGDPNVRFALVQFLAPLYIESLYAR